MLRSSAWNSLGVLDAEHEIKPGLQRIVFVALGLLLLVSALLKVEGPGDGALGQNTILFSSRLRLLVMEAEAILGLLLLSGWAKRAAWSFAVAFFLVVAGTSLYLGMMGQSSGGCFGRVKVSPWGAFALDMACLAALGLCRPSFRRGQEESKAAPHRLRDVFTIAGGSSAILVLFVGGVFLTGGNRPGDFLVRLRGERITVEPLVTDMGSDTGGQIRSFAVLIHNYTDHTITITGGTTTCACIATDDLPVSIPPGGSATVTVVARFKGTPGLFQQEFSFYTDDKDQDRVLAQFRGQIIGSSNQEGATLPSN